MEGDSIKFLLRRWDTFKKHFDSEFEFSAICHFKKDDDFSPDDSLERFGD